MQVLYLGRALRTKETLPDFREKCRVTRHSRVFRGLTGSQRTLGFRGVTFFGHLKHYYWEEPILYRHCADQVIKRCVPEDEMNSILNHCHTLPCGGHFGG